MNLRLLILFIVSLLAGCATAPNLNAVSLGMTKAEVIKTLGSPKSVSAKDNIEYLKYGMSLGIGSLADQTKEFFVRIVNGKVESYGNVGDFDSAKNPSIDINANVKTEGK